MNIFKQSLTAAFFVFFFISFSSYSQGNFPQNTQNLIIGKWKLIKSFRNDKEIDLSKISECSKRNYLEIKDSILIKILYTNNLKPCIKTIEKYKISGKYFFAINGRYATKEILNITDTILCLKSEMKLIETYKRIH